MEACGALGANGMMMKRNERKATNGMATMLVARISPPLLTRVSVPS